MLIAGLAAEPPSHAGSQQVETARQPRTDGPRRPAELIGGLPMRHPLQSAQDDRQTIFLVQPIDLAAENREKFVVRAFQFGCDQRFINRGTFADLAPARWALASWATR